MCLVYDVRGAILMFTYNTIESHALETDRNELSIVVVPASILKFLQDLERLLSIQTICHVELECRLLAAFLQVIDEVTECLMDVGIVKSFETKSFLHLFQGLAFGTQVGHAQYSRDAKG